MKLWFISGVILVEIQESKEHVKWMDTRDVERNGYNFIILYRVHSHDVIVVVHYL